MIHKSVLLHEAIDGLAIKKGDIVVDGTLGGGGHTEEIANEFGNKVTIVGLDLDHDAIVRSRQRLAEKKLDIHYVESSFRRIDEVIKSLGLTSVDKILLDIGLSSNQFEESGRGFSFQKNEPLVMSFKKNVEVDDLTAREIVNTWDLENIAAVIEGYGEESFAWKIAKAIVAKREQKPIETTFELVEVIKVATPKWYHHKKIHPATKTFQALRITVNDEIRSLEEGMKKGWEILRKKGRMAIISFHSLEDRKVKQFFRKLDKEEVGKLINKKPIVPNKEEIKDNPRSRSAKLRVIEKK
jgi:16S rRNA (cytosine1402-N4)-methyltransferase